MTSIDMQMEVFRQRFIGHARNFSVELDSLRAAGWNSESRSQVRDIAHRISGTAGMFGYLDLGLTAAELDALLSDDDTGVELTDPETQSLLERLTLQLAEVTKV